jgi:glycosyltransferase involved in cell wall biosynthesis
MRILQLSTYASEGGASRAALRLHYGLLAEGLISTLLVQGAASGERGVVRRNDLFSRAISKFNPRWEALPLKAYPNREATYFSLSRSLRVPWTRELESQSDVLHLHWVNSGFFSPRRIRSWKKPILWTLHDLWPFTGGCHYPGECRNFESDCGECPQLRSNRINDLSRDEHILKKESFLKSQVFIAPSRWIADEAKRSSILRHHRIEVLPNGIDRSIFRPQSKKAAKAALGLDPDSKWILFAAHGGISDPRKGGKYLIEALRGRSTRSPRFKVMVLGGSSRAKESYPSFDVHYLGTVSVEEKIAQIYSAADVFAAPSVQDNLPNTVVEALSCGTPTVAFRIGGLPDLVEPLKTGYLARPFESEDFGNGLTWILNHPEPERISESCAQLAEQRFSIVQVARAHRKLYEELLALWPNLDPS